MGAVLGKPRSYSTHATWAGSQLRSSQVTQSTERSLNLAAPHETITSVLSYFWSRQGLGLCAWRRGEARREERGGAGKGGAGQGKAGIERRLQGLTVGRGCPG